MSERTEAPPTRITRPLRSREKLRSAIRRHPDGARILRAVRKATRSGWEIRPGAAFVEDGCCCALGALRLEDGADAIDNAYAVLGWTHARAWAFAYGFDSGCRPSRDDESEGMHDRELRLGKMVRMYLEPGAFR